MKECVLMEKINLVNLTDNERKIIVTQAQKEGKTEKEILDLLSENENQTLVVLRNLKGVYSWDDIEDMVNYVSILKKVEQAVEEVEYTKEEIKLVIKVFKGAAKSKKLNGLALEKVVSIYEPFKRFDI